MNITICDIDHAFASLPTPCCLLDKSLIRRNADRIRKRIEEGSTTRSGSSTTISHRHHVKTLKSPQATRFALGIQDRNEVLPKVIPRKEDSGLSLRKDDLYVGSICCSTIAEVELFAADNFFDIIYAVGIEPGKVPHLLRLKAKFPKLNLILITDNADGIQRVADRIASSTSLSSSKKNNTNEQGDDDDEVGSRYSSPSILFPVLIEINVGQNRGGISAVSHERELLAIGNAIIKNKDVFRLSGVLSHSGHSYSHPNECQKYAQEEHDRLVIASDLLKKEFSEYFKENFLVNNSDESNNNRWMISAGSTPTASHVDRSSLSGLTEIRSGVHLTFDLDQSRIGSCNDEDIAITILTSVIGHQKGSSSSSDNDNEERAIVIDAGGIALSKDISAQAKGVPGYGLVLGEPNLYVAAVSQEHGLVKFISGGTFCEDEKNWKLLKEKEDENSTKKKKSVADFFEKYPVGSRLRILPHHACFTAAPYSELYAFDGRNIEKWESATQWY